MKSTTIASAAHLRQRLAAWCKASPGNALHLTMTVGGVPLTVRGGAQFGVRTATCGALLARSPSAPMLAQAGRMALGNVALFEAGLALDDASNTLWLSRTLHDPSPQAVCTALSALRSQARGWQRALAAQTCRERGTPHNKSGLPSMPPSWSMRR